MPPLGTFAAKQKQSEMTQSVMKAMKEQTAMKSAMKAAMKTKIHVPENVPAMKATKGKKTKKGGPVIPNELSEKNNLAWRAAKLFLKYMPETVAGPLKLNWKQIDKFTTNHSCAGGHQSSNNIGLPPKRHLQERNTEIRCSRIPGSTIMSLMLHAHR